MASVRLINENTQNIGVVATAEAMRLANEANLDLVEVAPDAEPPVCRIMDYGKHKYRLKKKQHLSHVKTHHVQLKQLRLSPVMPSSCRGRSATTASRSCWPAASWTSRRTSYRTPRR